MRKYIKYLILSVLLTGTLVSCDNYLEETNPNFVSSETFWTTLDESESNLTSVYGAMNNQYVVSFDRESLRADISYPEKRTGLTANALPWYQQTFTSNLNLYDRNWDGIYRVIWRANQVIEGLEGMTADLKSQTRWTTQMAEARFFRGMMHFWLHSNYNKGNIIIRDKVPVSTADFSKDLSTSEEAIAFFRTDIEYAYDNLPNVQTQKTRVSKGTAAFIRAKSYLYTKEYTLAIPLLNEVINGSYEYELLTGTDVKKLFTNGSPFNSESIFEINYSDKHQTEEPTWNEETFFTRWARFTGPTSVSGGGPYGFSPTAWLTYAYSNEVMDVADVRNTKTIGGVNVNNSVPLRAAQMIAVVNDEESTYYQSKPGASLVPFESTAFSNFKKLTNHDIVASEEDQLLTNWKSGKNVIVYRLADAYLMLAECLLEEGDQAGAIKNINSIRERWGLKQLTGVYTDGGTDDASIFTDQTSGLFATTDYSTKLRDHLRHVEKPLELALEGYAERSTDLRRWGIYKQRLTYLATLDFHLVDYTTLTAAVPVTRTASLLQEGSGTKLIQEHRISATNFIEDLHAYLPLPLTETLYNQNAK